MLGITCWHVRVVEHSARRVVHAQVQQEWTQTIELERPACVMSRKMGILFWGGTSWMGWRYTREPCWYP